MYPIHSLLESSDYISDSCAFFPSSKSFDSLTDHSFAEHLESLRYAFDLAQQRLSKELSRCTKLEDKGLRVLFAGYYKKEEALR